jgi:sulfatase maturation enzyme AslB (radical SAM superfamily)
VSLPIRIPRPSSIVAGLRDYAGYVSPFVARVSPRSLIPPMLALKTIEFAVYRWYAPPVQRTYGPPSVRELIYKITSTCTDRCKKCGIWREPEPKRASVEDVENCLAALAPTLGKFTVTGGEPLLFKSDVLQLARAANRMRVPMTVVSNGVLVDEAFLREYRDLGHVLVISIDTLDRSRWHEFRGRDHYEIVLENLRRARTILGERLKVQSVLAAETVQDVPEVARYCAASGLEHFVQPWVDFGGGWRSARAQGNGDAAAACEAWRNLCVMPNGDVARCFDHWRIEEAREPLGNLTRENVLAILARGRTRDVTQTMRACRLRCRQLSCNVREAA